MIQWHCFTISELLLGDFVNHHLSLIKKINGKDITDQCQQANGTMESILKSRTIVM